MPRVRLVRRDEAVSGPLKWDLVKEGVLMRGVGHNFLDVGQGKALVLIGNPLLDTSQDLSALDAALGTVAGACQLIERYLKHLEQMLVKLDAAIEVTDVAPKEGKMLQRIEARWFVILGGNAAALVVALGALDPLLGEGDTHIALILLVALAADGPGLRRRRAGLALFPLGSCSAGVLGQTGDMGPATASSAGAVPQQRLVAFTVCFQANPAGRAGRGSRRRSCKRRKEGHGEEGDALARNP